MLPKRDPVTGKFLKDPNSQRSKKAAARAAKAKAVEPVEKMDDVPSPDPKPTSGGCPVPVTGKKAAKAKASFAKRDAQKAAEMNHAWIQSAFGSRTGVNTAPYPPASDKKPPVMVCIDGMVGTNRRAVIGNIACILHDVFGKNVCYLDAPAYEDPTKMDHSIQEYIEAGYGEVSDPKVIANKYSTERNFKLAQCFNGLFGPQSDYDVILSPQWSISNLVAQTIIFNMASHPTNCVSTKYIPATNVAGLTPNTTFTFEFNKVKPDGGPDNKLVDITMPLSSVWSSAFYEDSEGLTRQFNMEPVVADYVWGICKIIGPYLRKMLVDEMVHQIYDDEILPWTIYGSYSKPNPYFPMANVKNVILEGAPSVLIGNSYQKIRGPHYPVETVRTAHAVTLGHLENIHYLYSRFGKGAYIATPPMKGGCVPSNRQSIIDAIRGYISQPRHGVRCEFDFNQIPFDHYRGYVDKEFEFDVVPVTTGKMVYTKNEVFWDSGAVMPKMRPIYEIVVDVWNKLNFNELFGRCPSPKKFNYREK